MEDRFSKLFSLMYRKDDYIGDEIYHYTGVNAAKAILRNDCVSLRMTHIDDFDDVFEGKTVEVFYDLSLENLKREGVIDDSVYNQLSEIDAPKRYMFHFNINNESNTTYCTYTDYDVYVSCFCEDGNSDYMLKRYIRDEDQKGYVIGAFSLDLAENDTTMCFGEGHRFELKKILYGRQIVESIEVFVKELLSIYGGRIDAEAKEAIRFKLSEMRYMAKLARYSREKEVRLILMIPKGDRLPENYKPRYNQVVENGKRYVYVSIPKGVIFEVQNSKTVPDKEWSEFTYQLKEYGYHLFEPQDQL